MKWNELAYGCGHYRSYYKNYAFTIAFEPSKHRYYLYLWTTEGEHFSLNTLNIGLTFADFEDAENFCKNFNEEDYKNTNTRKQS